jgi:hypothetical protein
MRSRSAVLGHYAIWNESTNDLIVLLLRKTAISER